VELMAETDGSEVQLVCVGGELTITVAPDLNTRLVAALGASRQLVVDMSHVDFLDSSIVGVLVSCQRRARAGGGRVTLVGLQPTIFKLFDRMGLTKVFAIYDTVAQVP
jgi:anti-sigma B factor antagonist